MKSDATPETKDELESVALYYASLFPFDTRLDDAIQTAQQSQSLSVLQKAYADCIACRKQLDAVQDLQSHQVIAADWAVVAASYFVLAPIGGFTATDSSVRLLRDAREAAQIAQNYWVRYQQECQASGFVLGMKLPYPTDGVVCVKPEK